MSRMMLVSLLALVLHLSTGFRAQFGCIKSLTTFSSVISEMRNKEMSSWRLYAAPRKDDKGPPKKKAPKDDVIQVNGRVIESLPNAMFRVEIEPSKNVVLVTISGKIRKNFVRIVVGDSVACELSAYDLTRGRITYRNK